PWRSWRTVSVSPIARSHFSTRDEDDHQAVIWDSEGEAMFSRDEITAYFDTIPNLKPVRARLSIAAKFLLACSLLSVCFCPPAKGQTAAQGQWTTLPYSMPINPVHMVLTNDGKVLIVSGSGNLPSNTSYAAAVWDPQAGTISTQPLSWDMFC